jgi:geranylgeranyl diphosphate synthase type II
MSGVIIEDNRPEYARAMYVISRASGIRGMIGGQCIDLFSENREIDLETLKSMHAKKTGALITASLAVGAIIAKAPEEDIRNIKEFGDLIGLAFQIADDILDVSGSEEKMGKCVNKDAAIHKSNFISFYGMDKSGQIAQELIETAKQKLQRYGGRGKNLCELADYIINRDN